MPVSTTCSRTDIDLTVIPGSVFSTLTPDTDLPGPYPGTLKVKDVIGVPSANTIVGMSIKHIKNVSKTTIIFPPILIFIKSPFQNHSRNKLSPTIFRVINFLRSYYFKGSYNSYTSVKLLIDDNNFTKNIYFLTYYHLFR